MSLMLSRYTLPTRLSAECIFRYLSSLGQAVFWLDSGEDARAGKSYLGVSAEVHTCTAGNERRFLAELRQELDPNLLRAEESIADTPESVFREPRFGLGWVGWFGYEFGLALLDLPMGMQHELPQAVMLRVRAAVEIDHETGAATVLAESEADLDDWMREHLDALIRFNAAAEDQSVSDPSPEDGGTVRWRDQPESYLEKITRCQEAIVRGDAYLLCLTTQAECQTSEPPTDLYLRLRQSSPTHHGGYLSVAGVTLASASPERFLAVNSAGLAQTKPIKGTRSRGKTPAEDSALAAELATDGKEQAENLMIVDLMRNDFSTVCDPATVRVTGLHAVETYPHVHQLVSTVTGQLRANHDALDLFAACFPAGSMTGAPKRRAVELLAALEQRPRGVYSGCFGYFSHDGSADLAMVIRSIVFQGRNASVGAGGGITSHSVPTAELAEVQLKASALLAALNTAD